MADFSYLKTLDVVERTAEFTLHQIAINGVSPTLVLASATEANKPYFNALLKRAGKSARQVRAGAVSASLIEENREEDKALYPKHVIKGWTGVTDANGADVTFSSDDCIDFIAQLPNWLFDDIRNFAGNPANFTDLIDVEVNAKN